MSGIQKNRCPVEDLVRAYQAGMPMPEMMRTFRLSKQRIYQLLAGAGVHGRPALPKPPAWNPIPDELLRATCHPHRRKLIMKAKAGVGRSVMLDMCRACFNEQTLLLVGTRERPSRIAATDQMGGPTVPPACPHCRAVPPAWMIGAEEAHCVACGQDYYRTVGVIDQTRNAVYARR